MLLAFQRNIRFIFYFLYNVLVHDSSQSLEHIDLLFCFYYKTFTVSWHDSFCISLIQEPCESICMHVVTLFSMSFLLLFVREDGINCGYRLVCAWRETVFSCIDPSQPRLSRRLWLSLNSIMWFVLLEVFCPRGIHVNS